MNAARNERTKDTYWTPAALLDRAREMGPIAFDPATDPRNPTKAKKFAVHEDWMRMAALGRDRHGDPTVMHFAWFDGLLATPGALDGCVVDGLAQDWTALAAGGMVWVNPPFGREKIPYLVKAHQEAAKGCEIQMITPCDPATTWWQRFCSPRLAGQHAPAVVYLRQRPTFIDPETGKPPLNDKGEANGAMFGCQIAYWGRRRRDFYAAWAPAGDVDLGPEFDSSHYAHRVQDPTVTP